MIALTVPVILAVAEAIRAVCLLLATEQGQKILARWIEDGDRFRAEIKPVGDWLRGIFQQAQGAAPEEKKK